MRKFFREYFSFSPSEIRALVILSTLIVISLAVRLFIPLPEYQSYTLNDDEKARLDSFMNSLENITYESLETENSDEFIENQVSTNDYQAVVVFKNFNPNTISKHELDEMNFPENIARNLLKFREAGGKIFKKSDFKKIYGVTDSLYQLWEPFIFISGDENHDFTTTKYVEIQVVELNTADSSELLAVRGIGPYFAGKIVSYRIKLGGYYKMEQLMEIKGMDSLKFESVRPQLKIDTTLIVKISLNSVSSDDLKSHPYISFRMAESILKYRNFNKGKVKLDELLENHIITPYDFERISPYLFTEMP